MKRPNRLSENGYFPQSLCQAQVLILKIRNVLVRLKSLPSLSACNSQTGLTLQKNLIFGQAHKEDNYADLYLGCTDKKG